MSRPPKYNDRFTTGFSMEKSEHDVAELFEIDISDACRDGISFAIRRQISMKVPQATKENISLFLEVFKDQLEKEIEKAPIDALQTTLSIEAKKPEKLISVWAEDEDKRIIIPESQYDPKWHHNRKEIE